MFRRHCSFAFALFALAAMSSGCAQPRPRVAAPVPIGTPVQPPPVVAPVVTETPARPAVLAYTAADNAIELPTVEREFRGVWVATVGNLDWPSGRDLTTTQAQQQLLRILDHARSLGLNAVILQVRPMADALYPSNIEPWSDYLTGESGRAPSPFWDPLQFAIEQAHARGLELHAWFNPFRAGFISKRAPLATNHVTRRRPDIVRRYGQHYWMDPGEPESRRQALAVITDVVRRYDVDAVHIDDYFYPYQEHDRRGRLIQFPDEATWREYGQRTGMTRNDWRRSNVNTFVEQLYRAVHAEKAHVRVGISPFGIWRPGYPAGVRGLDSYAEIFADSRKWLLNGWADYYAPQLYWRPYAPEQRYTDLLQWWSEQNPHGRNIFAGNIPNSVANGARGWTSSEILEQIRLTRAEPGIAGNIHFSASSLMRNAGGLSDAFRTTTYAHAALVPASPWLSKGPAPQPHVVAAPDPGMHATALNIQGAAEPPHSWIVHARHGDSWQTLLLPGATRETNLDWKNGTPPDAIAVISVDRVGVESKPAVIVLQQPAPR